MHPTIRIAIGMHYAQYAFKLPRAEPPMLEEKKFGKNNKIMLNWRIKDATNFKSNINAFILQHVVQWDLFYVLCQYSVRITDFNVNDNVEIFIWFCRPAPFCCCWSTGCVTRKYFKNLVHSRTRALKFSTRTTSEGKFSTFVWHSGETRDEMKYPVVINSALKQIIWRFRY